MATAAENEVITENDERTKPPFLRRVRIRGYKSIAFCDVALQPLTILVGRNASGKSNFIDALAFLRDCLKSGVPEAVQRRGNLQTLLCRSVGTNALTFEIETSFTAGTTHTEHEAHYRLNIPVVPAAGVLTHGEPEEWLSIKELSKGWQQSLTCLGPPPKQLRVFSGPIEPGIHVPPTNTMLLSIASGQLMFNYLARSPYIELADSLRRMTFYNFIPESMRPVQPATSGQLLDQRGSNLASVMERTRENEEEAIERVGRYLSIITESVELLGAVKYGEYETVRFRVNRNGRGSPLEFDAASMSDGTLRALAALVAAFQIVLPHGHPSLVAIEEPETSLHPAATHALVSALEAATEHTQVLLTTHSGDLLADPKLSPSSVLAVRQRDGRTEIAPVDAASREIIRRQLYTLADLHRLGQLYPDEEHLQRQATAARED